MRAKPVNEIQKFERGIDPKKAIGIGMIEKIKAFLKEKRGKEEYYNINDIINNINSIFLTCVLADRYDLSNFLLKFKEINFNWEEQRFLRVAAYRGKWKLILYLIDKGANLNKGIEFALKHNERETLRNLYKIRNFIKNKLSNES